MNARRVMRRLFKGTGLDREEDEGLRLGETETSLATIAAETTLNHLIIRSRELAGLET